jgi:Family of unknown function (DUF6263)
MLRQFGLCGRVFVGMFVIAATFLAAGQVRAEKVLRWKFTAGEKTRYVMKMEMTQAMNVGGNAIDIKMTQTMDMTWTVDSVAADGVATMSQTIDRMRMEMASQGPAAMTMKLDSEDKKKPEGLAAILAPVFDGMVGKPVAMKVTPRGEISDMKIPKEMLDAFKKVPGAEQMGGAFSEDGFKQMTTQGMLSLPEKAVADGATWTSASESKNPILGKQKMTTDYTYQGTETRDGQELEKIATKLTMKFEPPADAPAKVEVKDQDTKGMILFDGVKGRISESSSKSKMKMEITVMGMTIDEDMTVDVKMTLAPPDSKAAETPAK